MGRGLGPRLTAGERILVHLGESPSLGKGLEVPPELTQEGVATAASFQQRHAPQYLRPLIAADLVVERQVHVRGGKQRRKAYFLTERGRAEAGRLRGNVLAHTVEVEGEDGVRRSLALGEVSRGAFKGVPVLDLLRAAEAQGYLKWRPKGTGGTPSPSFVEMLSDAPRIQDFVGRSDELATVTRVEDGPRVFVVRGMAGIGKSSFGAKACELLKGRRNLFWHRVRPWDTRRSILAGLGDFLAALGKPALRSVLGRGEDERAPEVLREDLPGTKAFLVFDDAHEATAEVLALFRFLKDVLPRAPGVHALILTRRTLRFYDRRDIMLEKWVREMDLRGLKPEDIAGFSAAQRNGPSLVGVHREWGGHPLFLQLIRSSPRPTVASEARRDVGRFIEETVYAELSEAERRMMKVASLYKVPVPREALLHDPILSHDVLLSLTDRSLLMPVGQGNFEVHDTVQEFFTGILSEGERRELARFSIQQLRHLASEASSRGDLVACINYLGNALFLNPPPEDRITLWEELGDAHERLGNLPAALQAYREGLRTTLDKGIVARLHRKAAQALQTRGDMPATIAEVEKALAALGGASGMERGWLDLVRCSIDTNLERWDEARGYGKAALETFQELRTPRGQAQALVALGDIEIDDPRGDPRRAEEHLMVALGLAAPSGDVEFTAKVHNTLAHLYAYRFGDAPRVLEHLAAIEFLPRALEDPHVRRAFLMLRGWFSLELLADYAAATTYFTEAMAVARKIHDSQTLVFGRYALALVAYFQGRLDEARLEFEGCAEELRHQGSLGFAVEALWMVAECCLVQGRREGFRRVVAALDDPKLAEGMEARVVHAWVLRGLDRLVKGDASGSQAAFAQALRHAEREHGPQGPLLPFAHFFYGLALRTMGRKDKGLEHVQRAREYLQDHHLRARLSILPDRERRLKEVLRRWSSSS